MEGRREAALDGWGWEFVFQILPQIQSNDSNDPSKRQIDNSIKVMR